MCTQIEISLLHPCHCPSPMLTGRIIGEDTAAGVCSFPGYTKLKFKSRARSDQNQDDGLLFSMTFPSSWANCGVFSCNSHVSRPLPGPAAGNLIVFSFTSYFTPLRRLLLSTMVPLGSARSRILVAPVSLCLRTRSGPTPLVCHWPPSLEDH